MIDYCFGKLDLWVKFSFPVLNKKVNSANVKVLFSAKNVSKKINSNMIKNVLWGILLLYLNAKISFGNVFCLCISQYFFLSLHELPWTVVQLTLPFIGIKSRFISNYPISLEPIQSTKSWRVDHNFVASRCPSSWCWLPC